MERYDMQGTPTWRSPPLPLFGCDIDYGGVRLISTQGQGELILFNLCPNTPSLFITSSNDLGAISQDRPNEVEILDGEEGPLLEGLGQAMLAGDLRNGKKELVQPTKPFHITPFFKPESKDLKNAIAKLRTKSRLNDDLDELRRIFGLVDFRKADLSIRDENDLGYFLARGGTCADINDAIIVLRHTLQRAPDRASAHLNLADTYATVPSDQWRCTLRPSKELAVEHYRYYCAALLPVKPPRQTAKRVLNFLREVGAVEAEADLSNPTIAMSQDDLDLAPFDTEFCRPRLSLFDDLKANDIESFRAHIAEHPEDIAESRRYDYTILRMALASHNGPFVETLLAAGAMRFGFGKTDDYFHPLVYAVFTGPDTLDAMLEHGHFDQKDMNEALINATEIRASSPEAITRKIRMIKSLLKHGADVQTRGVIAAAASAYGPSELFYLLRDAGARINLPDHDGTNALFRVGPFNMVDTVATINDLLAMGVSVNHVADNGMTPLTHLYAWTNKNRATVLACTKILLNHGADPNLSGNDETALTMAARSGWLEHVELLLANGAHLPEGGAADKLVAHMLRGIAFGDSEPEYDIEGHRFTYRTILLLLGKPVPPVPVAEQVKP
ncbi:ankyrin repeat domain-containing protein [Methylovorus mays]|uniref:ankyrin repeat domain-containing protein n=1 Tax=Methylovorus mays TaxID=184077 RepID=UPI001E47F78E|nr:ankyrin repeat domain-containing protein [Methylovorus mays]